MQEKVIDFYLAGKSRGRPQDELFKYDIINFAYQFSILSFVEKPSFLLSLPLFLSFLMLFFFCSFFSSALFFLSIFSSALFILSIFVSTRFGSLCA